MDANHQTSLEPCVVVEPMQLLDEGRMIPCCIAYVQIVLWPLSNVQVIVYGDEHVLHGGPTVLMKCVTLCLTGRSILQGWTMSG